MKSRELLLLFIVALCPAVYIFYQRDAHTLPNEAVPSVPIVSTTPTSTANRSAGQHEDNHPATTVPVEQQTIFPRTGFKDQAANPDQAEIIGGEVVEPNRYPWIVALVMIGPGNRSERQFCGGSLISPEWVLTAAHCMYRGPNERTVDSFNVYVGASSLDDDSGQEIAVRRIIRHPNYHRPTANMDAALLRLAEPVSIPPIELASIESLDEIARASTVAIGWGKTESQHRSNELRHVNVPIVDHLACQAAYATHGFVITSAMLCAGFAEGGKDACVGDSGGPLVVPKPPKVGQAPSDWLLVGLVSWGKGCAQANAYGVYTNVGLLANWVNSLAIPIPGAEFAAAQSIPLDINATLFLPIIQ